MTYELQQLFKTRTPLDWRTLDTFNDETRARIAYDSLKQSHPDWNLRVVDSYGTVICGVGA